jgi:hypothetical protein
MTQLIWLNGPFGVGKTQLAFELHYRLAGSFVCDPEYIGYTLFKTIPKTLRGDFQDIPLWREFTYKTLHYVLPQYSGPVIVPMTICNPNYLDEIIGRLRTDGFNVHHFTLLAQRKTILKRLSKRFESSNSWAAAQIERCLDALPRQEFALHIDTENLSIEEIALTIATLTNLDLQPELKTPLQRYIRRIMVQIRHIRFLEGF